MLVTEGKGGHERLIPLSPTFFATVGEYLRHERPTDATTDRVFVVLKGQRRGRPLSAEGLDEILSAARIRAGLVHGTCHELRHTCLTRLREAGMTLEALQAQAGHRSLASTRVYLHLSADWLADEYRRATEAIEAQPVIGARPMSVAAVAEDRRWFSDPDWDEIARRAPQLAATLRRYVIELQRTRATAHGGVGRAHAAPVRRTPHRS